eukprot:Colp12_sorted_trinity150504_noHs@10061
MAFCATCGEFYGNRARCGSPQCFSETTFAPRQESKRGSLPDIHTAVFKLELEKIDSILQSVPVLIELVNNDGLSPLMLAVTRGSKKVAAHLIEKYNADFKRVNPFNGDSLAHAAARGGHRACLDYIRAMNIPLDTENFEEQLPFQVGNATTRQLFLSWQMQDYPPSSDGNIFDRLPNECITHIFEYLPAQTLLILPSVCFLFSDILRSDETFWFYMCAKGKLQYNNVLVKRFPTWRERYFHAKLGLSLKKEANQQPGRQISTRTATEQATRFPPTMSPDIFTLKFLLCPHVFSLIYSDREVGRIAGENPDVVPTIVRIRGNPTSWKSELAGCASLREILCRLLPSDIINAEWGDLQGSSVVAEPASDVWSLH